MRVPGNCPGDDMSLKKNQNKGMEFMLDALRGSGESSDLLFCFESHLEQISDFDLLCFWHNKLSGMIEDKAGIFEWAQCEGMMDLFDARLKESMNSQLPRGSR